MDKTIRRIKLSTNKDENGSFYLIIFENQYYHVNTKRSRFLCSRKYVKNIF